ncbi:MAG: GTPase [Planctomycetaceae bacterium]
MQKLAEAQLQARVLTARGPGAVAVIRLQGSPLESGDPFQSFTRPDNLRPQDAAVGRILYGRWNGEDLVIVRTHLQRWEIQCHGGSVAVERILRDLQSAGASLDTPDSPAGAAIPRASCSVEDRSEALISQALQLCRTRQAAARILQQADGRQVQLLRQIEAGDAIAHEQSKLWLPYTRALLHGFRVLLTGEPNAGKSSLLNALCGRQRAIVSAIPGTTRDLLDAETVVDGWIMQFRDSAGIRDDATSAIEADGIEKSLTATGDVSLICCVAGLQPVPQRLLQALTTADCPVLLVQNKLDLLTGSGAPVSLQTMGPPFADRVQVSALTGTGLDDLRQRMLQLLIPATPPAELALPLSAAI